MLSPGSGVGTGWAPHSCRIVYLPSCRSAPETASAAETSCVCGVAAPKLPPQAVTGPSVTTRGTASRGCAVPSREVRGSPRRWTSPVPSANTPGLGGPVHATTPFQGPPPAQGPRYSLLCVPAPRPLPGAEGQLSVSLSHLGRGAVMSRNYILSGCMSLGEGHL